MLLMDFLWFQVSVPRLYGPLFDEINNGKTQYRMLAGLFAWGVMAFGNYYFVKGNTRMEKFINGALLGLVIYGTYNGTNYATIEEWNMKVFFVDTLWGTLMSGTVASLIH